MQSMYVSGQSQLASVMWALGSCSGRAELSWRPFLVGIGEDHGCRPRAVLYAPLSNGQRLHFSLDPGPELNK